MGSYFRLMREDIAAVLANDPAARSALEVMLLYSGLHALWWYRIHHWFWKHGWLFVARALSQFARWLTESKSTRARKSAAGSSSITAWASSSAKRPRSAT